MIKVIEKALNIVEILARNPVKEWSLSEISGELQMDKGTCANIIKTMLDRGYIQHAGPRSGYKFGYMFYKLTDNSVNNEDLTFIANDDIIALGEKLNERIVLSIIKNDKRIFLMTTTPNREQLIKVHIDKSVYVASTGRVIIANYSPSHLQRFISRVGLPTEDEWPEIYRAQCPEKEFANRLAEIKLKGYDVLIGRDNVVGISVPLFRGGHVIGSIGCFLPQERMSGTILPTIMETAEIINYKLENQNV